MENLITLIKTEAQEALKNKFSAKTGAETKNTSFNNLAFLVLKARLFGTKQDVQTISELFTKNGEFYEIRQVVSNALPLALIIKQKGAFSYPTKSDGEKTVTLKDIEEANKPCFTVSSAYRAYLNGDNKAENVVISDTRAWKAYLELCNNSPDMVGVTLAQAREVTPPDTLDTYLAQGRAALEENSSNIACAEMQKEIEEKLTKFSQKFPAAYSAFIFSFQKEVMKIAA